MKYYPTRYGVNHLICDLRELDKSELQIFNKKLTSVIQNIPSHLSDYQKIKIIHDIVCRTCCYDYNFNDSSYNVKGFFNHQAVCFGISKWVHLALRLLNIKGDIICGVADHPDSKKYHAWNLVKIDGKELYLDVTWDMCRSTKDNVCYDYFLLSEQEINKDHFW